MSIMQANIWKSSIFKTIGSLFTSPHRTILCVVISENGIVSKTMLELGIGWCSNKIEKMSWLLINKLRMPMEGVEGQVLPISERSYIPLDPLGRLTKAERDSLVSLDQLAEAKWREARSDVAAEGNKSVNAEMMKTISYIVGFIVLIAIGIMFFKHK